MSLDELLPLLEDAPIFSEIGLDPTRLLAFSGEEVVLEDGEQLFQQGTPAEGAFVVLAGGLRLVAKTRGLGSSERLVGPGTLLGEMALLVPSERPCDAFAHGRAHLFGVPRPLFRRMLEEFPDVAVRLRNRLLERTRADRPLLDEISATLAGLDRLH